MTTLIEFVFLDGQKQEFSIDKSSIVVGRGTNCDIVLPFDGISRQHAQFEIEDGEVFVTDLGSTNGILIDGKKIPVKTKVPYQTFLTLQFGPFQSVVIHLKREMTSIVKLSSLQSSLSKKTQDEITNQTEAPNTGVIRVVKPGFRSRSKVAEKEEANSFGTMVLIVMALAGGAIYYQFFRAKPAVVTADTQNQSITKPEPVVSEFKSKDEIEKNLKNFNCKNDMMEICRMLRLNPETGEGAQALGSDLVALVNMSPFEKKDASKEFKDLISSDRYEVNLLDYIQKSAAVTLIARNKTYVSLQLVGFLDKERTPLINLKMNKDLQRRYMDSDLIGSLVDEARSLGILKSLEAVRPEYKLKDY